VSALALRKKISDLQANISQAKAEYLRKTTSGNNALDAEATTLRVTINKLRNAIANGRASIDSACTHRRVCPNYSPKKHIILRTLLKTVKTSG